MTSQCWRVTCLFTGTGARLDAGRLWETYRYRYLLRADFQEGQPSLAVGRAGRASSAEAGAACVTVVEDREGDIYECFAFKPANVEKLVRAAQDRCLADATSLFCKAQAWDEAGRMTVELPAAPGRKAREAALSVSFGKVEIKRPKHRTAADGLPATVSVTLVIGREIDPPQGEEPAPWFLLTTHQVDDIADARRIIGFYRLRWTIEQLFRTMKTKGFDCRSLAPGAGRPARKARHRHPDRRSQGDATRRRARR